MYCSIISEVALSAQRVVECICPYREVHIEGFKVSESHDVMCYRHGDYMVTAFGAAQPSLHATKGVHIHLLHAVTPPAQHAGRKRSTH